MPGFKQIIPLHLGSTPLGKFVGHPLGVRSGTLLITETRDADTQTEIPAIGNTMVIPNAAYDTAKKLLPVGVTQLQTSPKFEITKDTTLDEARFERTANGGIHGIIRQGPTGIAAGHGGKLVIPDPILEYIRARPNNRFGIGLWGRVTRMAIVPTVDPGKFPPQTQHFSIGRSSNKKNDIFTVSQDNTLTTMYPPGSFPTPGNYEFQGQEGTQQLGTWTPSFSTKWHGDAQPSVDTVAGGFWWGSVGGNANNNPVMSKCFSSMVFYGLIIEDLTVSNITTAKFVEDFQKETDKHFGVGGSFHGDTFSDPNDVFPNTTTA